MVTKAKHLKIIQFSAGLNLLGSGESIYHGVNVFAQTGGKFGQEIDP